MAYLYYNAYHALYNFKSDNLLGAVENYLGSSGLVLVAVGWTADRSSTLRALGLGGLPTRSGLGSIGIVLAILGVATVVGVLLFGAYVDTSVYFGRPVDCCTFDQVANEDVVSAFGIVLIAFGWLVSHLTTLRRLEGAT